MRERAREREREVCDVLFLGLDSTSESNRGPRQGKKDKTTASLSEVDLARRKFVSDDEDIARPSPHCPRFRV